MSVHDTQAVLRQKHILPTVLERYLKCLSTYAPQTVTIQPPPIPVQRDLTETFLPKKKQNHTLLINSLRKAKRVQNERSERKLMGEDGKLTQLSPLSPSPPPKKKKQRSSGRSEKAPDNRCWIDFSALPPLHVYWTRASSSNNSKAAD